MTSSQKMEVCAKEIERMAEEIASLEKTMCAHFSEELDDTKRWSWESERWSLSLEKLHNAWINLWRVYDILSNNCKEP